MEKEKRILGRIRAHLKAEMKRKIDDARVGSDRSSIDYSILVILESSLPHCSF